MKSRVLNWLCMIVYSSSSTPRPSCNASLLGRLDHRILLSLQRGGFARRCSITHRDGTNWSFLNPGGGRQNHLRFKQGVISAELNVDQALEQEQGENSETKFCESTNGVAAKNSPTTGNVHNLSTSVETKLQYEGNGATTSSVLNNNGSTIPQDYAVPKDKPFINFKDVVKKIEKAPSFLKRSFCNHKVDSIEQEDPWFKRAADPSKV